MKRTQKILLKVPSTIKQGDSDSELNFSSYEITRSPIKNKENKFSTADQKKVEAIFDMLTTNPKQAIEQLLVLREKYPHAPMLSNFLSNAYGRMGNRKAVLELVIENYVKNPDYLFAKINYAQQCLDNCWFEKIPEIFDHKFDLKLLYPNRNTFHVTEFAGFAGVMCGYYSSIGKQDTAQLLFDTLKKVTPESPMVGYAKSFLYPSLIKKLQRWIYNKRQKQINKLEF